MSTPNIFSNDVIFQGSVKIARGLPRDQIAQELVKTFPIPLTDFRVWNDHTSALGAAGTDDLGITGGTWAGDAPRITAGDLKAAGATTRYGRVMIHFPPEYDSGKVASLRFSAGMITTVSDTTATLDAEAFVCDRDGLVSGSDLVTTAAQTINSVTFANKDFVLTPTSLAPGSWLDVRIAVAVNDGATGTAVIATVGVAELLLTIRG